MSFKCLPPSLSHLFKAVLGVLLFKLSGFGVFLYKYASTFWLLFFENTTYEISGALLCFILTSTSTRRSRPNLRWWSVSGSNFCLSSPFVHESNNYERTKLTAVLVVNPSTSQENFSKSSWKFELYLHRYCPRRNFAENKIGILSSNIHASFIIRGWWYAFENSNDTCSSK